MRFVDTNIFVRYITGDDSAKAAACLALFQRVRDGREDVLTCDAIIAEVVYVLSSRSTGYGLSATEVRDKLRSLLRYPSLKIQNKRIILRALDFCTVYPNITTRGSWAKHLKREQAPLAMGAIGGGLVALLIGDQRQGRLHIPHRQRQHRPQQHPHRR